MCVNTHILKSALLLQGRYLSYKTLLGSMKGHFVREACLAAQIQYLTRVMSEMYAPTLKRFYEIADLVPTQVVQDNSYYISLEITTLEPKCLYYNDKTEEPGSYAAVISEVTKMLAAKSESFVYQLCVGDWDSSEDSNW